MAYNRTNRKAQETKATAERMNNIEQGILADEAAAANGVKCNSAQTLTDAQKGAEREMYEAFLEENRASLRASAWANRYLCQIDGAMDMDDLHQEAQLSAMRAAKRIESRQGDGAAAYMGVIVKHDLMGAAGYVDRAGFAKAHCRAKSLDAPVETPEDGGVTMLDCLAAEGMSTEEIVAARDMRRRIAAILRELPAGQRAVIALRYYGDMSHRQIAETMRADVDAVRALERRALDTLRQDQRMRQLWDGRSRRKKRRRLCL